MKRSELIDKASLAILDIDVAKRLMEEIKLAIQSEPTEAPRPPQQQEQKRPGDNGDDPIFWFTTHKGKKVSECPTPFLLYFTARTEDLRTNERPTWFLERPNYQPLLEAANRILFERGIITQPTQSGAIRKGVKWT